MNALEFSPFHNQTIGRRGIPIVEPPSYGPAASYDPGIPWLNEKISEIIDKIGYF